MAVAALGAFRELPYVVPYDLHRSDGTHSIMGSELAFLVPPGLIENTLMTTATTTTTTITTITTIASQSEVCVSVAALQRLIEVHSLPGNIIQAQLRGLHARMRVCERSAVDAMYLYVCIVCSSVKGVQRCHQIRGQCKLRVGGLENEMGTFVCSSCQNQSVVAVNTLGRVVSVRQQRYYLAPCCMSVQRYHATGVEFHSEFCDPAFFGEEIMARIAWRPDVRPDLCSHGPIASVKPQRAQCDVCVGRYPGQHYVSTCTHSHKSSAAAAAPMPRVSSSLETFSVVDHLTGEMRTAKLCQRHMPNAGVMRHVVNWADFVQEVLQRGRSQS